MTTYGRQRTLPQVTATSPLFLVRETVGGDLKMAQVFRNGELSEHHFWNVLPDGSEMDLTSSQFDGSETFRDADLAGSVLLRCGRTDEC